MFSAFSIFMPAFSGSAFTDSMNALAIRSASSIVRSFCLISVMNCSAKPRIDTSSPFQV